VRIEDRLAVNKYDIDRDIHIAVNPDVCTKCHSRTCLYVCPAGCFTLVDGRLNFSYEGCLECGTCRIVCEAGAITWTLPRPGLGISYEYG